LKRCPGKAIPVLGKLLHAEPEVTVESDRTLYVNHPDEWDKPVNALLGMLHAGETLVAAVE
jgi:hypothetical protein